MLASFGNDRDERVIIIDYCTLFQKFFRKYERRRFPTIVHIRLVCQSENQNP